MKHDHLPRQAPDNDSVNICSDPMNARFFAGDDGGLVSWQPPATVFPDGLTDWLGLPLSLYLDSLQELPLELFQIQWIVVYLLRQLAPGLDLLLRYD
jgi:hypothetical protein